MSELRSSDVTIVITTKNRADMVQGAIRSALDARPAPARVIVVDSGSDDDTLEKLRVFGDSIQVIAGRFRNAAMSRNVGAAAVETDFIGFLDSDDLMLDAKIACLEPLLREQPEIGLVSGRTEVIDEQGYPDTENTSLHTRLYHASERRGIDYATLARAPVILFTSATLIRRTSFEDVGGYDEANDDAEDVEFYLRLSLNWRLAYAACTSAKYRLWGGNYGYERSSRGVIAVAEKHLAMLSDVPEDLRREARFGFLERSALAHHRLLDGGRARRVALAAVRCYPSAALASSSVRRVLFFSLLPRSVLRKRRPG